MTRQVHNPKALRGRRSPAQWALAVLVAVLGLLLVLAGVLVAIELVAYKSTPAPAGDKNVTLKPSQDTIERGAYLARVGNCAGCHTARGGSSYAGGKAIATPFGAIYTSNITPDTASGIGSWSADAFYRALHEGRSADGHLLAPAFPYPNYTHVSRADADAMYAYFMHGVAPVAQPNRAHALIFPYNTQIALAVWRVLFFEKVDEGDDFLSKNATKNIAYKSINTAANTQNEGETSSLTAEIERGAYLVRGLGHCSACHAGRNALGASTNDQLLSGALMPMQDWYAPSLMAASEAGVAHWSRHDVVALLKTGIAPNASMAGPMAEVVAGSTQFWTDADLSAAAAYLQSLPETSMQPPSAQAGVARQKPLLFDRGAELFTQHCATCHGEQGQGMKVEGNVALPALAGNRAVTMANTANLLRMILAGGYAPSTAGNPRPFGMPPFVHVLNDTDIAAVTTYIRNAWGNQADSLSAAEIVRQRKGLLQ